MAVYIAISDAGNFQNPWILNGACLRQFQNVRFWNRIIYKRGQNTDNEGI
jgi:hypothetical protein